MSLNRLQFSPASCQFPEDLMFEIFLRLPVKLLLRFRSVSKSFLAMIDSHVFIKEHAHRSLKTKSDFQLIYNNYWGYDPHYVDFSNGNPATAQVLKYPFYPNRRMIGCCNGIICLRDDSQMPESYTLWNPSTRKYKKIESLPHGSDYVPHKLQVKNGFGYDQVKDDYKIVRIHSSKFPFEMQVYSLKSNSWRKLDIQLPVGYFEGFNATAVYVQGALHWFWSSPVGTPSEKIAAFHLDSETLHWLTLPPCLKVTGELTLISLDDDLCIMRKSFLATDYVIKLTIWVMEEYGNKDSWKTFDMDTGYLFTLPNSNTIPYIPVTRGKLIAYDRQESKWFLIEIQQLKDITSQDVLGLPYYKGHGLFVCWNSLVQL